MPWKDERTCRRKMLKTTNHSRRQTIPSASTLGSVFGCKCRISFAESNDVYVVLNSSRSTVQNCRDQDVRKLLVLGIYILAGQVPTRIDERVVSLLGGQHGDCCVSVVRPFLCVHSSAIPPDAKTRHVGWCGHCVWKVSQTTAVGDYQGDIEPGRNAAWCSREVRAS